MYFSSQPALSYHTSAVLGVCVDTITMPYRLLTPQAANMSSFVDSVAFGQRKIASLSSTFPLPVEETVPLASLLGSRLHRNGRELLQSITPGVSNSSFLISQSAVIRGIPSSLTHNPQRNVQTQNPLQHENPFEVCSAPNEIVQTFLQNLHPETSAMCWNVNQACMVKPPFPNIFAPRVTSDGFVVEGYARPESGRVNQTSVLSRVETNSGIANMLSSLIQWAKKVNINKHHLFLESGTEVETFKEMLEELTNLSQRYEYPWHGTVASVAHSLPMGGNVFINITTRTWLFTLLKILSTPSKTRLSPCSLLMVKWTFLCQGQRKL